MPDNDNRPAHQPAPEDEAKSAKKDRTTRNRRQRNQDSNRQDKRRQKMKDAGEPETHRVHSALVEAFGFAMEKRKRTGSFTPQMYHFAADVVDTAIRILVDGKGCAHELSTAAVWRRLEPHGAHVRGIGPLKLPRDRDED